MPATVLPVFVDHHVHLGLVDASLLPANGIGAVVDLGWSPEIVELAATAPLEVDWAGQFLAAPGGYPAGRPWAPAGSTVFVSGPDRVGPALVDQLYLGSAVIKVTLNSESGPVFDEPTLTALVEAAHDAGRQVVAHVQGAGMVERSLAAGVDVLAHTPWTEPLPDDLVSEAARTQRWISTLDIHGYGAGGADFERARDNLARFHEAGGGVLYGTDLGNGPLPTGLNPREVKALQGAGLDDDDVIAALTDPWPHESRPSDTVSVMPGDRGSASLAEWLAGARAVPGGGSEVDA